MKILSDMGLLLALGQWKKIYLGAKSVYNIPIEKLVWVWKGLDLLDVNI